MKRSTTLSALTAVVVVVGIGWLIHRQLSRTVAAIPPDQADAATVLVRVVRLSQAKLANAGITTQSATRQTLPLSRVLPARFKYDATRHVAIRAATDGVLESVSVKPGDAVDAGQPIAILRSPAIGTARAEVLSRLATLELAETERTWHADVGRGVEQLAKLIRDGQSMETIEQYLDENATLGIYRSRLLANHSRMLLASKLVSSAVGVGQSGAISGRVIQRRQSEQEQTQANLDAAIEQSLFETQQRYKKAEADANAAYRSLIIARQTLATLLGTAADAQGIPDVSPNATDLARLEIRSPLSGTVERMAYSVTERVTNGAELFIVADTSKLWVEADIRGRDWDVIRAPEGTTVFVTTPAISHEKLEATVHYVGREVDPGSGAIPLVARVSNEFGKYRPGLFARMEVPIGELSNVLVLPESAIVDIDGETCVLVQQDDGFVPVAISLGVKSGNQFEVRSGIQEGQAVVVTGAFLLKSELLLEGEG